MDLYSILTLVAGLALFLYGMHLMSTWLKRISGGRMERVLERATANKYKGVLFGAGVTAVIQSSSATTVIVVGLVSSGVMTLAQSVSVIMGANVGTTATAWILSLTGVEGDSIIVNMLKPSNFAPILAIVGVALLLFAKREKKINVGGIMVGFAILMLGMDMMASAMEPLEDSPEFVSMLTMFNSPFMGVVVGTAVTAIIQSSSASVGILQALSTTGAVTYGMAIPIIFGQNIGTCVTALISCIGATRDAKRAAVVHLSFNLIGTAIFLILFYAADAIWAFPFMTMPILPTDIAIVHTVFNVSATALLLPFSEKLKQLACFIVRGKDDKKPHMLDDMMLKEPAFALEQCRHLSVKMANTVRDMVRDAVAVICNYSKELDEQIEAGEQLVDEYEDELSSFLVKLSSHEFSMEDGREVGKLMLLIDDFERIGDHAENVLEGAREMYLGNMEYSLHCSTEFKVLTDATLRILDMMVDAYEHNDIELARSIEPLEDVIDSLRTELKNRHIIRLQEGDCSTTLGFLYMDMLSDFERIADHCSNIALGLIQIKDMGFGAHGYVRTVKEEGGDQYRGRYLEFSDMYKLPDSKQLKI